MTSRLIAIGFCLLDAMATLLAIVQGSATLLAIILSLIISSVLAFSSYLIRSVYWPTYFWDAQPESAQWGTALSRPPCNTSSSAHVQALKPSGIDRPLHDIRTDHSAEGERC